MVGKVTLELRGPGIDSSCIKFLSLELIREHPHTEIRLNVYMLALAVLLGTQLAQNL